jgi:hypothetical protein
MISSTKEKQLQARHMLEQANDQTESIDETNDVLLDYLLQFESRLEMLLP